MDKESNSVSFLLESRGEAWSPGLVCHCHSGPQCLWGPCWPLWLAVGRDANVDSCGGRSRVVMAGTCVCGGSRVAMEKR